MHGSSLRRESRTQSTAGLMILNQNSKNRDLLLDTEMTFKKIEKNLKLKSNESNNCQLVGRSSSAVVSHHVTRKFNLNVFSIKLRLIAKTSKIQELKIIYQHWQ